VIRCEGGRCRIEGAVTVETVGGLLRALQPHLAAGIDVLDFSAVERVDSAALALVFSAMRQNQGKLACTGLPASFATLAELYGVADLLPA
jgi:phospholipid transport system transporter-binding protein